MRRDVEASEREREAARAYLLEIGLEPIPDAVAQLSGPFSAALAVMCTRGYDPDGLLWREAGWKPQLYEAMKKMARIRFWAWKGRNKRKALREIPDLLNYLGFMERGINDGIKKWGEWGKPS